MIRFTQKQSSLAAPKERLRVERPLQVWMHSERLKEEPRFKKVSVAYDKIGGVWFSAATDQVDAVLASRFSTMNPKSLISRLLSSVPDRLRQAVITRRERTKVLEFMWEVYEGERPRETPVIHLSHLSDFRRKVYRLTSMIPYGKVATYGGLAKALGSIRYARAIGGAMAANPLLLTVPCHRVVSSDLHIGRYSVDVKPLSSNHPLKRALLVKEGVFLDGEKVSPSSVWRPG